MIRRTMALALIAGAAAVLVSPASALASWTHSGAALAQGQDAQLESTGPFGFQGELGGIECQIIMAMTLTGGTTTGSVQKFELDGTATEICDTTGLLPLVGCTKIEAMQNTSLPWSVHRFNTDKIQMTTGEIHFTLFDNSGDHCAIPQITLKPGNVTLDIPTAQMNAISSFQFSGELTTSETETVEVTGSHQVFKNAGTYGI